MRNSFYIFISILLFAGCSKEQSIDFSSEEINDLLTLSDTSLLKSETQVEYDLGRIASIFQKHDDNCGMFPLIYQQTTHQALLSLQNEPQKYNDIQKAKSITIAFCKRYLFNLHDYLTGKTPEYHWKNYYDLCNTHQPRTRILSAGLNAHLTVDLARAVYDVNGDSAFKADYMQFGEALVKASPYIIAALRDQYHVETAYLFHGLFIGDILDPIFGQNYTTQLAFQFIREEAYQNGQYLLSSSAYDNAQTALHTNWKFREDLLNELVKSKLIQ